MGKSSKRPIPKFQTPLIETHCHLDYLKDRALEETLERSFESGIEKMITISVSPNNVQDVFELSKSRENVFCTQGIHPHEAKDWTPEVKSLIETNLKAKHVVAVGEIGLDYHYDNSPRKEQQDAFEQQLQLACDYDLPVVIHSRDAEDDTISILKNFPADKLQKRGVVHSFTSSLHLAEYVLDHGFYLGFNGIITFNSAEEVRKALRFCPLHQLLLETDSPFLTPVPYRGRENSPFYLPFVAEKMAEQKDCEIEELLAQVYQNSHKLFAI